MTAHAGKRAAYWFGKRDAGRPFSRAGDDAAGRDGRVSMSERWFSDEWWRGHHKERDAGGRWEDNDGARERTWGAPSKLGHARKASGYAERQKDSRAAYKDYLVEREHAAAKATKEYMVTAAGRRKGYDQSSFFHPNASARPGRRYMTDELRSWFGDGDSASTDGGNGGGGILTFARWQKLTKQQRPD